MAMKLDITSPVTAFLGSPAPAAGSSNAGGGFAAALGAAVSQVEAARNSATTAANNLLASGTGYVHSVALAAQRADLTLEMFQQVRNKFVQAYQEIMKMPM